MIDKKQWSSWVIALGLEIANSKDESEIRWRASVIVLGMEKLIDEIDRKE